MKKTIFYLPCNEEDLKHREPWIYYFNDKPYLEWFTLNNSLYEPSGNIRKRAKLDGYPSIMTLIPMSTIDTFSTEGVIRRIAFNVTS